MTKSRWYTDEVLIAVDNASKELLLALAHQIEAEAKVNMRVDTGFNWNSSYVVGAGKNTFQARSERLKSKKTGKTSTHSTVPNATQPSDDNEVVVGFAADYAIYEEIAHPTLYPALVRVAQQVEGIVQTVGRKHLG